MGSLPASSVAIETLALTTGSSLPSSAPLIAPGGHAGGPASVRRELRTPSLNFWVWCASADARTPTVRPTADHMLHATAPPPARPLSASSNSRDPDASFARLTLEIFGEKLETSFEFLEVHDGKISIWNLDTSHCLSRPSPLKPYSRATHRAGRSSPSRVAQPLVRTSYLLRRPTER